MLKQSYLCSYLTSMTAPLIVGDFGFMIFQLQTLYNSEIIFKPPLLFDVEC